LTYVSKILNDPPLHFHAYGTECPFAHNSISRYLRLGCYYPLCCTTGTMTSTRSEEGKNSYGILICKKTYVHIGTIYVEIPSWFVFTLASQFGALAHLRIGPTWKRTGCMPCWVICTSWFAKAWPAGQLKHHTTGAHTFLGEIPKRWANFRREKITVLKAL
jgi:hypothetical protein